MALLIGFNNHSSDCAFDFPFLTHLEFLLEFRECWSECIGEIEEYFVHQEHGFFADVRLCRRHQCQDIVGQIPG